MGENVMSYVVVAIIIAVGAIILGGFQDNITDNTSAEYTVAGYGLTGMSTFGSWLPLIAVIIAAVVILGFVVLILPRLQGRGSGT